MSDFDELIDSLSEEALEFCIDNLYDVLNYKYLPRKYVGIYDIKEKLNNKSWCSKDYIGRDYMRKQNEIIYGADRIICEIESIDDFVSL